MRVDGRKKPVEPFNSSSEARLEGFENNFLPYNRNKHLLIRNHSRNFSYRQTRPARRGRRNGRIPVYLSLTVKPQIGTKKDFPAWFMRFISKSSWTFCLCWGSVVRGECGSDDKLGECWGSLVGWCGFSGSLEEGKDGFWWVWHVGEWK